MLPKYSLAIFCDGDFWHGRHWSTRRQALAAGANGTYWTRKIEYNLSRDRLVRMQLRRLGWTVFRFWETDILADPDRIADLVSAAFRTDATPATLRYTRPQ